MRNRQYVTIAIWTMQVLTAYAAGRFNTIAFAPMIFLLGFLATMRMLND